MRSFSPMSMNNGGSALTSVCGATCDEEFLKISCRRTRWWHLGTLWCWPESHAASASHPMSSWSHFFPSLSQCPSFKKAQHGPKRGGTWSCSMAQLKIPWDRFPAVNLNATSNQISGEFFVTRSSLSLNVLATAPSKQRARGDKLMTTFFWEFFVSPSKQWAVLMLTAPRAESNCCKWECTGARAGDSGAPRKGFLLRAGPWIPTSLH